MPALFLFALLFLFLFVFLFVSLACLYIPDFAHLRFVCVTPWHRRLGLVNLLENNPDAQFKAKSPPATVRNSVETLPKSDTSWSGNTQTAARDIGGGNKKPVGKCVLSQQALGLISSTRHLHQAVNTDPREKDNGQEPSRHLIAPFTYSPETWPHLLGSP